MNNRQLSEHIGNIDDRLIKQAEQIPDYAAMHRKKRWRNIFTGVKNAIYIRMVSVKAAIPYNISPLKPCMVPSMLPNA